MTYDFDRVTVNRNPYSIKHNPSLRGKPADVLPMWIADMDFPAPDYVSDALAKCAKHGVYGYSEPDGAYYIVLRHWFANRFNWDIKGEWAVTTPGVVSAIYIALRALTQPEDGVIVQQPAYHPFASAVKHTGRRLLVNELVYDGSQYIIDFNDFEEKAKQAKAFILCSPHNPVGRVWTRDELTQMGGICLRYGVAVISDEIHQDLVYPGNHHLVFAGLDARFANMTVTCTSPSKTFNLAGLQLANIFIPNKDMRASFENAYASSGLSQASMMGLTACQAAYEGGAEWLDALLAYLAGNMAYIREFLNATIPGIKLVKPEGTYLAWLDCKALGLSPRELDEKIINEAKLWLNAGGIFGQGGVGFERLNAACPRDTLEEGLKRLAGIFGR